MSAPEAPVQEQGEPRTRRRPARADALRALAVVVVFALAGAAGGWVWHHLWTPPLGQAVRGQWYPVDETSLGQMFGATGLYLLVGVIGGLVLGFLTGLALRRSELLVLGAVIVGSVLAAWLTHRIGVHLGPPPPEAIAATAPDRTTIPDDMTTPGHSFYVAWPLGSLLGLAVAYLLTGLRWRPPTIEGQTGPRSEPGFDAGGSG